MNDQMVLISQSPIFQDIFRRDADQGALFPEFVMAFQPVFEGRGIADPTKYSGPGAPDHDPDPEDDPPGR